MIFIFTRRQTNWTDSFYIRFVFGQRRVTDKAYKRKYREIKLLLLI